VGGIEAVDEGEKELVGGETVALTELVVAQVAGLVDAVALRSPATPALAPSLPKTLQSPVLSSKKQLFSS